MPFRGDRKYLIFPVSLMAPPRKLLFNSRGELIFDLDIALDFVRPDYEAAENVGRFMGLDIELMCGQDIIEVAREPADAVPLAQPAAIPAVRASDHPYPGKTFYREKGRPRFHFSARQGWINDPNGLFFYHGVYHLFFQHNPVGHQWGNMHWGHAASRDLLHWDELDCALFPDKLGTMFSGSAIVDEKNVTGLKTGEHDTILLYYTAAGGTSELSKGQPFTQCLATSTDGGATFQKYAKNPIIGEIAAGNRDPKVIYDERSDTFVMALYLDGHTFALLTSKNLLDWRQIQTITIEEEAECPDFYPLAADGDPNRVKWVISGASGRVIVGDFDGRAFTPLTGTRRHQYGDNSYAAQTWSNLTDNRRVRIAWDACEMPAAPFSRSLSFPCEMSLKTVSGELALFSAPIGEISALHHNTAIHRATLVSKSTPFDLDLPGKAYDISLMVPSSGIATFRISLFGLAVDCDLASGRLTCLERTVPIEPVGDAFELRILIDKTSVELFINQGITLFAHGFLMDDSCGSLRIESSGGSVFFEQIAVAEVGEIFPE